MRELDRRAVADLGLDVQLLMEVAGAALARHAREMRGVRPGPALLLVGGGHNGGDGLVASRHLRAAGVPAHVLLWAEADRLPPAARRNLDLLRQAAGPLTVRPSPPEVARLAAEAGVIVDCLFGTGFHGVPRAPFPDVIAAINAAQAPILAADIPSGLSGDLGQGPEGACVRATRTLCMGAVKAGLFSPPGRAYGGEVVLEPLGIPEAAWSGLPAVHGLEGPEVAALLPPRRPAGHKGTYGTVLALVGSLGMAGAAALAAGGALRAGCGLCRVACPEGVLGAVASQRVEATLRPLPAAPDGTLAEAAAEHLPALLAGVEAVVAGPGLGRGSGVRRAVLGLLAVYGGPLVLDADGLNAVELADLRAASGGVIITPHPGEAGRLLGISSQEVQADRLGAVRRLAADGRCVAVLKGAGTLVAVPDGPVACNPTGNDGMGTGGTGDVLAGIVAGLAAQGADPQAAATAGVYVHGLAGDLAAEAEGRRSLVAGDLLEYLGPAFRRLLGPAA
jgi:NAD(P)H-hydrate epimerase